MSKMTKLQYYNELVKRCNEGSLPCTYLGMCKYRRDQTSGCYQRCVVGILIPNDKYNAAIDVVFEPVEHLPIDIINFPEGMYIEDLSRLQIAHDRLSNKWDSEQFLCDAYQIIFGC